MNSDPLLNSKLDPNKVTKPIQLLAAWLLGLIIVNGSFLACAISLGADSWKSGFLIIASAINVPLFLGAIFLLQTRFRPEMQEDSYYSQYLDKKTNEIIKVKIDDPVSAKLSLIHSELIQIRQVEAINFSTNTNAETSSREKWLRWTIAVNVKLQNYKKIRATLKENHIPVEALFGDSDELKEPNDKILSINRQVDFNSTIKLLKISLNLELDGYLYHDPIKEIDPEDIYFGSYGDSNHIIPFTKELKELINDNPEIADLRSIEARLLKIDD